MMRHLRIAPILRFSQTRAFATVVQPSLDIEIPGIPELKPASAHTKPSTKISTLSNGLRVATEETYGPIATIGVFVNAGSRCETHETNGVSHLLEHMAFKGTHKRSGLRLMRDLEDLGATVGAQASRDCIMYYGECLRDDIDGTTGALAEAVLQPTLYPWHLNEQREVVKYEHDSSSSNMQQVITEMIHAAAFGENSPLGRPLWCPLRNLESITVDNLNSFLSDNYHPGNMVLAGAGVDHEQFVQIAEKYFLELPSYNLNNGSKQTVFPESKYVGGRNFLNANLEFTQVSLAFDAGSWHSEDLLDMCTLHYLLGGGGSFSAGGPGKGMYSRLYCNILNRFGWCESATAFNSLYTDHGLFGIYGSAEPEYAGDLVNVFCDELLEVANGKLTDEEISRAKNQTKSALFMKVEERQVLFEDIARQILVYGKRYRPEEFAAKVDAVSKESIQKFTRKLLKSQPSLAAFGDISKVPRFDQVAKKFA